MSLKAVTASAYRASKEIDLVFRGPPTEWPTTKQKEEFERWAEMEGGNEIWIGARISSRGPPSIPLQYEDILVLPGMGASDLASRIEGLVKDDKDVRITGMDADVRRASVS
ncbi:hypothetical protein Pmar_PMAR010253 [Perkinsus marinus ATCC 50983]|uniref:Uncharacterized protein n=1 Tax=Perkinsus marinus (strain ATCC 50983 / TXsc) TaxID=423536 RepID=C5K586_PERM5|nr:hypothetical protein Pmar_PMAR010253 [Perkinsus marinus ATCC 50983]EER20508.1 hypothetical protein Pmar_PMAR010253 [Perkinsus marinus ATCC 50983]|eukprot:XP_002788712.1 hypothetical protein Pmar_PMAR010253 [Perkinsus marinus ATCC 50983]